MPSYCPSCDYKRHPDGGFCYMFRDEPVSCLKHTALAGPTLAELRERFKNWNGPEVSGSVPRPALSGWKE